MSEQDTGQVTGRAAEIYEEFFVPALFADWPRELIEAADVRPADRVLDVACGTGVLARAAAERVGADGSVAGVDINDSMLAVARRMSTVIDWHKASAEALPFSSDVFDRVLSQFGLMFCESRSQALQEMVRVTRPGGKLAIAVWASLDATPGYATMTELLRELFGADVARRLEAPYGLGDKKTLTALLRDAGIGAAHIETLPGVARFPSIEAWVYTDIKGWTLADRIDDAAFNELLRIAPGRLAGYVQRDGSVAFDAPAHVVSFTKPAAEA